MKGIRISITAGLLAATVAVWLAGNRSYLPGPAAKTQAETRPQLQPEVVVIAPAPELPVMDTVVVTADRETGPGAAVRVEPAPGQEAVVDPGSGSAIPVRKPITGYAPGRQPGETGQGYPEFPERFEQ